MGLDVGWTITDVRVFFCRRFLPEAVGPELSFGGSGSAKECVGVMNVECGRAVVLTLTLVGVVSRGALGEPLGIGLVPCGALRNRKVISGPLRGGFFSGSGAQVDVGRWSEGSMTRPSDPMMGSSGSCVGDDWGDACLWSGVLNGELLWLFVDDLCCKLGFKES